MKKINEMISELVEMLHINSAEKLAILLNTSAPMLHKIKRGEVMNKVLTRSIKILHTLIKRLNPTEIEYFKREMREIIKSEFEF